MTGKEFWIHIQGSDKAMTCRDSETILLALSRQGYTNLSVGCRNGGCGVCKIRVIEGEYDTGKMSKKHVPQAERALDFTLACKTTPRSDLTITTEM